MGTQKQMVPQNIKKGKKLLFNEEPNTQSSNDVSQKKILGASGVENLLDRDLTEKKWCMEYVDVKKKFVLYAAKKKGDGQLHKETAFTYARILRFDYEDEDSTNIVVMIDCSRGVSKVVLCEDRLIKESCGPESFKRDLENSKNIIVTLRPYIQGHINLREPSSSPVKAPKKPVKVQSRPQKKKTTKMLDSKSSSSTDDDDTKGTPGVELASGVLSSE